MKQSLTLEEIQVKLLELTELKKQVVTANDSVNRLFNSVPNNLSWDTLERSRDDIERYTIPYFYVEYVPDKEVYCLVTQAKRY